LIDPHGDLADRLLAAIPTERTNHVVVLDPSDDDYAVPFNPLACDDPDKRDRVADEVLSAFTKVYDLSQSPRLKDHTPKRPLRACRKEPDAPPPADAAI